MVLSIKGYKTANFLSINYLYVLAVIRACNHFLAQPDGYIAQPKIDILLTQTEGTGTRTVQT